MCILYDFIFLPILSRDSDREGADDDELPSICHIRRSKPDQKLSSHFSIYKKSILIYKNSILNYITSNLIIEAHVIRTLNS